MSVAVYTQVCSARTVAVLPGWHGVAEATPKKILCHPSSHPKWKYELWYLVDTLYIWKLLVPPLAHPTPPLEPPQIQMCRTATDHGGSWLARTNWPNCCTERLAARHGTHITKKLTSGTACRMQQTRTGLSRQRRRHEAFNGTQYKLAQILSVVLTTQLLQYYHEHYAQRLAQRNDVYECLESVWEVSRRTWKGNYEKRRRHFSFQLNRSSTRLKGKQQPQNSLAIGFT